MLPASQGLLNMRRHLLRIREEHLLIATRVVNRMRNNALADFEVRGHMRHVTADARAAIRLVVSPASLPVLVLQWRVRRLTWMSSSIPSFLGKHRENDWRHRAA